MLRNGRKVHSESNFYGVINVCGLAAVGSLPVSQESKYTSERIIIKRMVRRRFKIEFTGELCVLLRPAVAA